MPRLGQYLGRWILHSGWYPDRKIRLFDRKKAKWVGDYVHESVLVTGRVGHRQENILHSLKLTLGTKKTTPCGRGSEKLRFNTGLVPEPRPKEAVRPALKTNSTWESSYETLRKGAQETSPRAEIHCDRRRESRFPFGSHRRRHLTV
jgi:hypothetical protein